MIDPKTVERFSDIDFGDDLPEVVPDISMEKIRRFSQVAHTTSWRFTDQKKATAAGLPGAVVPGVMSQGILVSTIHSWAPRCTVHKIDTIFRAPLLADSQPVCRGVVTNMNEETNKLELDLSICNEEGETRVLGTAIISLPS